MLVHFHHPLTWSSTVNTMISALWRSIEFIEWHVDLCRMRNESYSLIKHPACSASCLDGGYRRLAVSGGSKSWMHSRGSEAQSCFTH